MSLNFDAESYREFHEDPEMDNRMAEDIATCNACGKRVYPDEPLDLSTTETVTGIVRDASLSDSTFTYKLEATS